MRREEHYVGRAMEMKVQGRREDGLSEDGWTE